MDEKNFAIYEGRVEENIRSRHCERSEAIQLSYLLCDGLLRCAGRVDVCAAGVAAGYAPSTSFCILPP
jgi:hypothetical protein